MARRAKKKKTVLSNFRLTTRERNTLNRVGNESMARGIRILTRWYDDQSDRKQKQIKKEYGHEC